MSALEWTFLFWFAGIFGVLFFLHWWMREHHDHQTELHRLVMSQQRLVQLVNQDVERLSAEVYALNKRDSKK